MVNGKYKHTTKKLTQLTGNKQESKNIYMKVKRKKKRTTTEKKIKSISEKDTHMMRPVTDFAFRSS